MLRTLGVLVLLLIGYLLLHTNTRVIADLKMSRIDEILPSSRVFDGKEVTVKGIVTGGVGLMGIGGYHLRDVDSRQEIFVVSASGVPPTGATVTVTGTFRQALTMGSYELPVIILNP
jgi:hypothetical protein